MGKNYIVILGLLLILSSLGCISDNSRITLINTTTTITTPPIDNQYERLRIQNTTDVYMPKVLFDSVISMLSNKSGFILCLNGIYNETSKAFTITDYHEPEYEYLTQNYVRFYDCKDSVALLQSYAYSPEYLASTSSESDVDTNCLNFIPSKDIQNYFYDLNYTLVGVINGNTKTDVVFCSSGNYWVHTINFHVDDYFSDFVSSWDLNDVLYDSRIVYMPSDIKNEITRLYHENQSNFRLFLKGKYKKETGEILITGLVNASCDSKNLTCNGSIAFIQSYHCGESYCNDGSRMDRERETISGSIFDKDGAYMNFYYGGDYRVLSLFNIAKQDAENQNNIMIPAETSNSSDIVKTTTTVVEIDNYKEIVKSKGLSLIEIPVNIARVLNNMSSNIYRDCSLPSIVYYDEKLCPRNCTITRKCFSYGLRKYDENDTWVLNLTYFYEPSYHVECIEQQGMRIEMAGCYEINRSPQILVRAFPRGSDYCNLSKDSSGWSLGFSDAVDIIGVVCGKDSYSFMDRYGTIIPWKIINES